MNTNTIVPRITPQQQMALAFRDFSLPEGTVKPNGEVHVWAIRKDGEWLEALAPDVDRALFILTNNAVQGAR